MLVIFVQVLGVLTLALTLVALLLWHVTRQR